MALIALLVVVVDVRIENRKFVPLLVIFVTEENGVVTITVILNESDMGKVIGRQGKLAKALRTIVRSAGAKDDKKFNVEIKAKGEV